MEAPKIVKKIISPFGSFVCDESLSGLLLLIAAFVAIIWANSPWSEYYTKLWHTYFSISIGPYELRDTLLH